MNTSTFKVFDDSDKFYVAWLQGHQAAYVLNQRRGKSANYLILHRASCVKIGSYTKMSRPGGFTERSYIKICSDSIDALHEYARGKGSRPDGTFSSKCRLCRP